MKLDPITRGKDGRFSAFGTLNGRRFVADAASIEEAQEMRQELKFQAMRKSWSVFLSPRRMGFAGSVPQGLNA